MIKISFTEEDIKELHHERFHHLHPRVQMKMEALYLKATGHKHKDIAKSLCLTETTVRSYIADYAEGGIEALKTFCPHQPTSELRFHTLTLKEEFEKNPPATSKEAVQRIHELTGIKRSPTQVREFLKKTGLSILRRGKSQQK
jgi:transposase